MKARWRSGGLAVALVSLTTAGCGGSTTDVSQGVDSINKDLRPRGAQLQCPKEVNGAAGTVFSCTLVNPRNKKTAKVKMHVIKQNGQLAVAFVNEKSVQQTLIEIGAR
jgi:hypothetical protein